MPLHVCVKRFLSKVTDSLTRSPHTTKNVPFPLIVRPNAAGTLRYQANQNLLPHASTPVLRDLKAPRNRWKHTDTIPLSRCERVKLAQRLSRALSIGTCRLLLAKLYVRTCVQPPLLQTISTILIMFQQMDLACGNTFNLQTSIN